MLCKVILLAGLSYFSPTKPDGDDPIDTLTIEGIVVNSKLQRYSSALMLKVIPALDIKQNRQLVLSDMLSSISNISVNSYGSRGVSLASLRGLSSYHTAILWNGINLQNPMNGGVNLTNIPVNFIDQLTIQYGGNGALFGSGAIGGTIQIDNLLEFGKGYSSEVYQTYGSYNSYFTGINFGYSGQKFASSTRVFYTETENNYRFHNTTKIGTPYENQVNSNSSNKGLMQNFMVLLSKKDKLSASIWVQDAFNRYPPMMTASTNNEKDKNFLFRNVIQWCSSHKNVDFNTKAGYFQSTQKYRNPGISDTSNHYSNSWIIESEAIIKISENHSLETGVNVNNEQITSTNYPASKSRIRPAVSITYKFSDKTGKLELYTGIREEMVERETNPITWSVGSRVKLSQRIILRGNISRNYRIPDMNDLFWAGYKSKGNPNLKPEHGYSEEIGFDYLLIKDTYTFIPKINIFNNNVADWIIWVPDNNNDWSSVNSKRVWARGFDASISLSKSKSIFQWGIDLMGTYTKSTTQKSNTGTEIGKQLPYIPIFKVSGSIFLCYKSLRIKYNQSYTGKRYTIADNSLKIDPYTVANICIEKSFGGQSYSIKSFVRIDNIWNEEYQVMAWYPMPLRSYQIGVSILFNKPIH